MVGRALRVRGRGRRGRMEGAECWRHLQWDTPHQPAEGRLSAVGGCGRGDERDTAEEKREERERRRESRCTACVRCLCWQLRELRDSLTASTISLVCVWACVSLAVLRVGVSLLAVQRCILEGVVYCLYVIYISV